MISTILGRVSTIDAFMNSFTLASTTSNTAALVVALGIGIAGLLVLALIIRALRSQTLALGFATTAAQWALAYVAMIGPGQIIGDVLFALTLACPVVAGFIAARAMRDQASALGVGCVSGFVNLLVVGALVGGGSSDTAMIVQAAIWSVGMLVVSGVLAMFGAWLSQRILQTVAPQNIAMVLARARGFVRHGFRGDHFLVAHHWRTCHGFGSWPRCS